MRPDDDPDRYSMSFGDHLEELRRRVLWSLALPLPLFVLVFLFREPLIAWLYRPLDRVLAGQDLPRGLQSLGPAEVLGMELKLSLILALVVSAPWILWQAWLFVRPGLYRHERRFVHFLLPGSALLTAAGVILLYYAMLPLMLTVLVHFGTSITLPSSETLQDPRVPEVLASDPPVRMLFAPPEDPAPGDVWVLLPSQELSVAVAAEPDEPGGSPVVEVIRVPPQSGAMIAQEFRLTTYVNFVLILMLGIVIAFQMPLVMLLLGWLEVVTVEGLRTRRRHALLICAAVAAVITPADALSMIMMLIPLYGLYELSILLLLAAPASAVAEGTVWRRRSPSHNPGSQSDQTHEPRQTKRMIRKDGRAYQRRPEPPDDQEGEP